jgi:hypothetical protein
MMRLFWRGKYRPAMLAVWLDPRHPGRERFLEQRELIEAFLDSDDPEAFALERTHDGHSLRTLIREIPVLFPDWFREERNRLP